MTGSHSDETLTLLKLKATFNNRTSMYVCVCNAVTDRDIKNLLSEGVSTVTEVMQCTGAGTRCGTCVAEITRLVEERRGPATVARRILPIIPSSNAA